MGKSKNKKDLKALLSPKKASEKLILLRNEEEKENFICSQIILTKSIDFSLIYKWEGEEGSIWDEKDWITTLYWKLASNKNTTEASWLLNYCNANNLLGEKIVPTTYWCLNCWRCKDRYEITVSSWQEEQQKLKKRYCNFCLNGVIALKKMEYVDYLKTDHWKNVRKRILERDKKRCQLCASTKRPNVHHNNYKRKGEEWDSDLITLCTPCHKKHHDKLPNPKTDWWKTDWEGIE